LSTSFRTGWACSSGPRHTPGGGELRALRWRDVDLAAGEITFARSVDVLDGVRVEGSTKGGRSRVVPVDEGTVAALRTWRRQQSEERLRMGAAYNDTG
jgi:integrase